MPDSSIYAVKAAANLQNDLDSWKGEKGSLFVLIQHLMEAYEVGYRKGLEEGHKTKWRVVEKSKANPEEPGEPYEWSLSREFALIVAATANRVQCKADTFFDVEPEEKTSEDRK